MMDDRLKELLQELGNAINESLSDSDQITEAIGKIKLAGYDVFLVLEASMALAKREFDEEVVEEPTPPPALPKWNPQDKKFLRMIKIAIDEDGK